MAHLKGVIFGVENVLIKPGASAPHIATLEETGKLVRFLKDKGVESVVMTNRDWVATRNNGSKRPLEEAVKSYWGVDFHWFQCGKGGVPVKQTGDSIRYVRESMGWDANETLFIGNTDVDMHASVNGGVLLLNAQWYEKRMDYGFSFDCPKEVARFIDTFCFRDHFWYFKIENGDLRVYSLAPFSTFFDEMSYYSNNFLANVKNEFGRDEDFWAKFLSTSLYFSGIYSDVNYITAYPKHEREQYPQILIRPMTTFAKCFRKSYMPDLILRHTTAPKSQWNRDTVTHNTQLDSICLNQHPNRLVKDQWKPYASFPVKEGSTVLVIDDVCTKGMSFEAARVYLQAMGAQVICVSFLKALKHDYMALNSVALARGVFGRNTMDGDVLPARIFTLRDHVVDRQATRELDERLRRYRRWEWPVDC